MNLSSLVSSTPSTPVTMDFTPSSPPTPTTPATPETPIFVGTPDMRMASPSLAFGSPPPSRWTSMNSSSPILLSPTLSLQPRPLRESAGPIPTDSPVLLSPSFSALPRSRRENFAANLIVGPAPAESPSNSPVLLSPPPRAFRESVSSDLTTPPAARRRLMFDSPSALRFVPPQPHEESLGASNMLGDALSSSAELKKRKTEADYDDLLIPSKQQRSTN
eukprot:Phypoly_transcript_17022.p1 GENE.Phypoly_transcript_17022~~Phypoly_transcript_17022.p1  ORF type:complete len:253 (+),score=54.87 Phypoly_transcript_17022:104-760(+)